MPKIFNHLAENLKGFQEILYNNFKYSSPWRESNKAELFIGDYGDKIFTVPIKAIMCQFLNYWIILFVISKGILIEKIEHTNMV